jgi:predicted Zn-dependent protease
MTVCWSKTSSAALMCACLSTALGAQQKACDINESKPTQIAKANLGITLAAQATDPNTRARQLRDALRLLGEKGVQTENPVAANLARGKAYVTWLGVPNQGPVVKRGDIGLATDKDATIDLVAAADSAFSAVEQARPECAETVAQYRRQQPWLNLVNAAIAALNAEKLDSAEALAKRSMMLDRSSPYPYYVLGTVAQRRNDLTSAVTFRRKTVEAAGTDTLYNDLRQQSLMSLGDLLASQVQSASGAQKSALAREAAQAYKTFLAEAPSSPDAAAAQRSLAGMLVAAGDSSALGQVYSDQLANPTKYSDMALVQGGVIAVQAGRNEDAMKLFEAALAANPYHRDALQNLAAAYYGAKQYDRIVPVVQRLVAVDPANPDAWLLFAYAYQGLMNSAKDPKLKRQYTDSLVKYNTKSTALPVKVAFTHFLRDGDKVTLNGTIENRSTAAKTYALKVDFLDKSGQVLATETASVGPVAPKATGKFSVNATRPGIVGYRYGPVP